MRPVDYDYDLFVIGAGSGGVRASRMSAARGARVAVAEEAALGGTCVNVGCIPKKLLVYASHYGEEFEDAALGYGWSRETPRFDWPTLIEKKNREIERLNGIYARLLDTAGVDRFEGRARLEDPHTVSLEGRRYRARYILLAAGGWPTVPEVPGRELAITSNEAFYLERLPERVLVVGGGYIGVEFAGIWNGMGARVTQLYRGSLFLRGFDDDLRHDLAAEMRKKGVDLRFDLNVTALEKNGDGIRAELTDGSALEVDEVLFATGRAPNTKDLGLEAAGVDLDDHNAIVIDDTLRTNVPNIYAIGDITSHGRSVDLTPVAIHEGMCIAATLFGEGPRRPNYENIPSAVFSQPPLGTVGLTEAEARRRGYDVEIYRSRFRPLRHTLTGRDEQTTMKLLVDRADDRVLGVHVLGPDAGEIVQGFAVALQCGATKADFDATIGIHPTGAEELVTMREPAS